MADMKIKALRAMQLDGKHVKEGSSIKVDEAVAKDCIRNKWAVAVAETEKPTGKGGKDDNTPPAATQPLAVQNDAGKEQGEDGV